MLETAQQVAEGWYPDPTGRLWLRRWVKGNKSVD